jgi:7-cyano-7-deazaguanine synthase in queuosine biosynthesis
VTQFHLRTRHDQVAPPPPVVLLDWFGNGSTIQRRQSLTTDLKPPAIAFDFLRFAGAVFCADKLATRPGTWTRSLTLDFAARDIDRWTEAVPLLVDTLSFLSGDRWDVRPFASTEPMNGGGEPADCAVDAVCLFSGGLDSFAGAVDLLADGKKVCLVAHYEGGQAPRAQERLARRLISAYGHDRVVFRTLFLRPAPHSTLQERPLPDPRESSTRTRSILFLAAGLVVAAGYGPDVPLVIPENGFIGINVPLTEARNGSLSTRTTHPYFMERLHQCCAALGITNSFSNPFRIMTKGEVLGASRGQTTLHTHARETLSCAHPEAPRYAMRPQGNCGYCFPCLIRRASLHHVGLDSANDYAFDALNEDAEMTNERGADLRALVRSLNRSVHSIDVLRNGPVLPDEFSDFAGVFERGRAEILAWLRASSGSPGLRSQLPMS